MMSNHKKFLDGLDEEASSEEEAEDESEDQHQQKRKRKFTIEELEECGYKERPSILYVPEPQEEQEGRNLDHQWTDGRAHRKKEEEKEETVEERQVTEKIVHDDVEAMAQFAVQRMELVEKLRVEKKQEQRRLAKQRKLTFNQKEKAKRNAGQASGGKNFIQEEKRIGRNFGLYSGFDT